MVNVCGLTSGSLLAYRLRGGEGDGGDLHWLDRGWKEEARRLGGALLGPVTSVVYYLVVAVGCADRNP